jgi:hypothetical protein
MGGSAAVDTFFKSMTLRKALPCHCDIGTENHSPANQCGETATNGEKAPNRVIPGESQLLNKRLSPYSAEGRVGTFVPGG